MPRADEIELLEDRAVDGASINERAIAAAQIDQLVTPIGTRSQLSVEARNQGIVDDDVVLQVAANSRALADRLVEATEDAADPADAQRRETVGQAARASGLSTWRCHDLSAPSLVRRERAGCARLHHDATSSRPRPRRDPLNPARRPSDTGSHRRMRREGRVRIDNTPTNIERTGIPVPDAAADAARWGATAAPKVQTTRAVPSPHRCGALAIA